MIGTATTSRSHLIFGLCLPFAVLLGYILAEPAESGSLFLVLMCLGVASIPLFMKWHHVFMLFSCEAIIYPYFFPGKPPLWLIAAGISMFLLILNRTMGHYVDFFRAKRVSQALIFLSIVTAATAYANGVSFGSMGGGGAGGKRYVMIIASTFAFFSLSSMNIDKLKANKAVAIYFLSSLTGLMGYIALLMGPSVYYYTDQLFPMASILDDLSNVAGDVSGNNFLRFGGLSSAAIGLFCFLLAVYGIRELLEYRKPWRMFLMAIALTGCLFSGFRSNVILFAITFSLLFYFEGLVRTRYFIVLSLVFLFGLTFLVLNSDRLPQSVQRTICFIPGVSVDLNVRAQADASTQWRIDLWEQVIPTIPRYLIKGKGYGISQRESELVEQSMRSGYTQTYEYFMLTSDYHSGPLSVLIPLGIFGVLGFLWFLYAALQVLYANAKNGDPALRRINTFILSYFIAQMICFFFVFGSLFADLINFAGLAGLSVALNGGIASPSTRRLVQAPAFSKFKELTI